MKKINYKIMGIAVICFAIAFRGSAQDTDSLPPASSNEAITDSGDHHSNDESEIIIRPKDDKDSKVTIEIRDGEFYVNGKPLDKFENQNLEIEKRKLNENGEGFSYAPSPFRGNYWNQQEFQQDLQKRMNDLYQRRNDLYRDQQKRMNDLYQRRNDFYGYHSNAAFLGVASRKAETGGATVLEVTPGSAADKGGLKKGDIITGVNDKKIESPSDLSETIHQYKPGDKVKITFKRDGKEQSVHAVLEKSTAGPRVYNYKYDYQMPEMPVPPDLRSPLWDAPAPPKVGMKVQDSEQGKGVRVLDITEGSAADKAGLKKGDIITRFDGNEVNSADELARQVGDSSGKSAVKLKILRKGQQQELEIKLPRKLKTAEL